jgi:hypothetical protein
MDEARQVDAISRRATGATRSMASAIGAALMLAVLPAPPALAQDAATVQLQQQVMELQRANQQLEQRIAQLERFTAGQSGLATGASLPRGGVGTITGAQSVGGVLVPGSTATTHAAGGATTQPPGPNGVPSWLNSADWDRIRPGMPELDVIRILGVPNSLRDAGNGRMTIFYAVEIGTARFLSGTVTLADRRVVEVQKPALR